METLRGIPPLIISPPVSEPVTRVSERRENPEKKRSPKRPVDAEEAEIAPAADAGVRPTPIDEEEASGQHVDAEA
ncbi:MAG: hypothetical protein U0527_11100 [Candidatus Eisenbacteria bacterium]